MKIFSNSKSIGESGTYFSNAIKTGNNSATKNVLDNCQKVKKFFHAETKAILVSAFLTHEGIDNINGFTMELLRERVNIDDDNSLRRWLYGRIREFLRSCIMQMFDHLTVLNLQRTFPCTIDNCSAVFHLQYANYMSERTMEWMIMKSQKTIFFNIVVQGLDLAFCCMMVMILSKRVMEKD